MYDETDDRIMRLMVNGAHGVYVPQIYAEHYRQVPGGWYGVNEEDIVILESGPEHEFYWEAWDVVLNDARRACDGYIFGLAQMDGDLWVVCLSEPDDDIELETKRTRYDIYAAQTGAAGGYPKSYDEWLDS